jgi:hypothetical protein
VVSVLLIGALVGLVIATSLPVFAENRDSAERATLAGRVARLERRVSNLTFKIRTLQNRTSQLSSSGSYSGTIQGFQISGDIDAGQIEVPFLCTGDPAVWSTLSFGGLDC